MKKLKRVVIKEELVELTGDYRPAIILNQMLYWTERMFDTDNYIREEKTRALNNDTEINIMESKGWIYKTAEDLNEELMVGMSTPTIRKYIKQLVEKGYLVQRKNPKYKWDKTIQYRVDLYKIQLDLGKLGYALEGYRLLPNIQIVEEAGEIEESENIEVDENKKDLPVGADKPNENQNINDNNSIPQNKEKDSSESKKNHFGNNCQNNTNNLDEENINYEKLAYESLKDNPIFNQLPPAAQQARLISEINKIKILGLYR
jgi:hypothetical protein